MLNKILKMSRSVFIDYKTLNLETDESNSYCVVENDENASKVTTYIRDNNVEIRRGDIIDTVEESERYRNDGKFIWDGEKAILLHHEYDDYGAVPPTFEVSPTEFDPNYWNNTVCHNTYYWPCLEYREQVKNSLVFDSELSEKEIWHGKFIHNGEETHVIVDDSYDQDYVYDPTLPIGSSSYRKGVLYCGTPHRERYPRKVFEDKIMDINIPLDGLAKESIDFKKGFDNVSLLSFDYI